MSKTTKEIWKTVKDHRLVFVTEIYTGNNREDIIHDVCHAAAMSWLLDANNDLLFIHDNMIEYIIANKTPEKGLRVKPGQFVCGVILEEGIALYATDGKIYEKVKDKWFEDVPYVYNTTDTLSLLLEILDSLEEVED